MNIEKGDLGAKLPSASCLHRAQRDYCSVLVPAWMGGEGKRGLVLSPLCTSSNQDLKLCEGAKKSGICELLIFFAFCFVSLFPVSYYTYCYGIYGYLKSYLDQVFLFALVFQG